MRSLLLLLVPLLCVEVRDVCHILEWGGECLHATPYCFRLAVNQRAVCLPKMLFWQWAPSVRGNSPKNESIPEVFAYQVHGQSVGGGSVCPHKPSKQAISNGVIMP